MIQPIRNTIGSALPNILRSLKMHVCLAALLGLLWVSATATALDGEDGPTIDAVSVGIDGHFKLGQWTHLEVTLRGASQPHRCRLSWIAPDGEGVNVESVDDAPILVPAQSTMKVQRLIRIGRTRSVVEVQLSDEDGERFSVSRKELSPETGVLRSDELMIVGVGPDGGFDRWVGDRSSQADDEDVNFVTAPSPASMPTDWVALQSVDLLVVNSSDAGLWDASYEPYWKAVRRWVSDGGVLILCAGRQGPMLGAKGSPLVELLPGEFDQVVEQSSSTGAEMFTSSTEQLLKGRGSTFSASRLLDVRGEILAYEGQNLEQLPLVVRSRYGMGRVLWVGVDLDQEPFVSWKSRPNFIGKLMDAILPDAIASDNRRRGRVGHLGYNDLAGQLRGSLDRFSQVAFVTFTSVAVLVTFFILLIGPGDFWLLKLLFRRMEWTWVTGGVVVVLFSVLAVVLFNVTKGRRVQINQAELLDIDAETGQVRGTVWAHVYAPHLRRFDLSLDRTNEFTNNEGRSLLTWQGLSGTGLGGMDAQLSSNLMQTSYVSAPTSGPANRSNQLDGLAVQVASTRPLTARWWDTLAAPVESGLYADRRNNTLHGDILNSLPFTLDRAVVFYDTWAYEVNGDIDPGETISIDGQTVERTLEAVLARRRVVEGNALSVPWDPKGTNVARILEMMSFYRAAGGRNYTSLSHHMHADLDWSSQLEQGQAILFARAETPIARLHDGEQSLGDAYDQTTLMIRIILPVEQR